MSADMGRVVVLGASNLTRGFQTVVSTSRSTWGPQVEVDLPLVSIRGLSSLKFLAFRSLLVPSCRLSLAQVLDTAESLRLYFMRPERRWLFGVEQFTPQSGVLLPSGGRVWLY